MEAAPLELLFKLSRRNADPYERLIRFFTGDRVHTELRVTDGPRKGHCFSSRPHDGVAWLDSIDTSDAKTWQVYPLTWLGCCADQRFFLWANCEVGKPYNWVGAIASALHEPMTPTIDGSWFCSQSSIAGIKASEYSEEQTPLITMIPNLLCPQSLYDFLEARRNGASHAHTLLRTAKRIHDCRERQLAAFQRVRKQLDAVRSMADCEAICREVGA
jgi:hypothetical protein